jgi:hypothetical protein
MMDGQNTSSCRSREAVSLGLRGYWVGPLCHPTPQRQCGCGRGHQGHNIGKAPLTANGFKDSVNTRRQIWEY